MAETLCKNCGKPIRRSHYAAGLGTGWTHINGVEFNGVDHCQTTYAEPEPTDCPQPCVHLSQEDAREGKTCPEHPCTCEPTGNES